MFGEKLQFTGQKCGFVATFILGFGQQKPSNCNGLRAFWPNGHLFSLTKCDKKFYIYNNRAIKSGHLTRAQKSERNSMAQKITWKVIRDDFKQRHPTLHRQVMYWRPHDYATIVLYFTDGTRATYNYDTKQTKYI